MINGERWRSILLCQVQYLKMKKDFKKQYDAHMKQLRKKYPNLTFIGADGAPRGERDRTSKISIPEALGELQAIVTALQRSYPKKRFTLDGRLVGDLGEVLAESEYDINLFTGLEKHYDAICSDGRLIQIKTTLKDSLTFPCDHVPDYYLGIKILPDGNCQEIFNGPGKVVHELVKNRKLTKTNLHSISIKSLRRQNETVEDEKRIPERKSNIC
jgi:hypothetical protein